MDPTGHAFALAMAVIIAVAYVLIIRFVDLNEKEPLWSVGLLFIIGAIAALVIHVAVNWAYIAVGLVWPAVIESLALFLAIAAGMWVLFAIGAMRGWTEVSGTMDGVVYGATVGLGYATGAVFIQQLMGNNVVLPTITAWDVLWTNALAGLADGVFGGIIGFGFGAAAYSGGGRRVALPILMLVVAIFIQLGYRWLSFGDALGDNAMVRRWVALLVPVALIVLLAGWALWRERRAIREQLRDESAGGAVANDEYVALQSVVKRQKLYLASLFGGNLHRWAAVKSLHNRQVQLALAKQRLQACPDAPRRAAIEREIALLRQSIAEIRGEMSRPASAEGAVL